MDRTIAPVINPLSGFKLQEAEQIVLNNGIRLHTINNGDQPLVRLEVVFEAGTKYENKPGVSFITSKMLQEGTKKFTAAEIQENIASLGAFIEINHGTERISLTFYLLTKYVKEFLVILEEIMLHPVFPEENFKNIINISTNNIKVNLQKTSVVASQEFKKLLYGENHYYGYSVQERDLDVVTISDVTDHYESHIKNSEFEVFIAGSIDITLSNVLKSFFEKFHNVKRDAILKNSIKIVEKQEKLVEKIDALQSSIRIGRVTFPRVHEDYFKSLVTNEILGGYFGSRLMKNIREEKGLTYGISSQLVSLEESGYFVIGTDVKKEFTRLALDEIYKEIEIMKTQSIPEDELETVTSYMHGSYLGSINSAFALMDKYKTIHYAKLDYDYFNKYIHTLKTIKQQDIQEMAQKWFLGVNEVVVGGYQ